MIDTKKSYLNFVAEVIEGKCQYQIWNDKHEHLGRIQKMQVGQWQSWCLFLNPDCYMSASCLDETREKIRNLNNNKIRCCGSNGKRICNNSLSTSLPTL